VSELEFYAKRVVETRAFLHQLHLRRLRAYIKAAPLGKLLQEIRKVESLDVLRASREAGLPADLQAAVLRSAAEIWTRRGEGDEGSKQILERIWRAIQTVSIRMARILEALAAKK